MLKLIWAFEEVCWPITKGIPWATQVAEMIINRKENEVVRTEIGCME